MVLLAGQLNCFWIVYTCSRLFEWIHDIEDKNALYSIDPFKHENGHLNNNTLFVNTQFRLSLAAPEQS